MLTYCDFICQIHSAPITCIVVTNQYVFTGAQDSTVKVWRRDGDLRQVRHWHGNKYHCGVWCGKLIIYVK